MNLNLKKKRFFFFFPDWFLENPSKKVKDVQQIQEFIRIATMDLTFQTANPLLSIFTTNPSLFSRRFWARFCEMVVSDHVGTPK